MKKLLLLSLLCFAGRSLAQNFSPIATTGYNLDAIAENTTAVSTTGGPVDGNLNVMYSYSYGQLFNPSCTGLANNGLLTTGTRTYQLQPYTQNNTLYIPQLQTDSLLITTPAPYPSISLVTFATEGATTMNIKLRFTDGTTQTFSNLSLLDWYTGNNSMVVSGFDRCNRNTGTPDYNTTDPNMYYVDLNLSCANRSKNLQSITVVNLGSNPRICVMAVSGSTAPSYSVNTSPVTCSGGNNGSATVTASDGVPPFTYNWGTTPALNTGTLNTTSLLPVGVTNYTVTDAANCDYVSSVTIGQAIVAQPPLVITASADPICAADTVILTTTGANTYTWSSGNSASSSATVIPSVQNNVFTVVATTSANCTVNGSYTITVNPLPVITFTSVPAKLCLNANPIQLSASPSGGTFDGTGISFGSFYPNLAGVGTQSLSYTYMDGNGCTAVDTVYTTVSSPTTVIAFTITPSSICVHSPRITLTATPAGGNFTGPGVSGSAFTPSVAGIGTRTVTYTYTDNNNCTAYKTAAISVTACATATVTGIEEYATISCQLYPNPNNGSFTLKADVDLTITLVNQLGQSLQTVVLDRLNSHEVHVENLPAGIYFLKAKDQILNQKIIVAPH